jgi:DNA replication and repair protein RecF
MFWDQLLCKAGGYITDARAAFISYVSAFVLEGVRYQLVYDKSVISENRLMEYANEEVAAKATLVGPHRDDVLFMKLTDSVQPHIASSWKLLSSYGSRGEQRLGVLWAKMAELTYIQEKTGDRPILLLDDIFSELDPEHQRLISTLIQSYQCVITSADPEDVQHATGEVEQIEKILLG